MIKSSETLRYSIFFIHLIENKVQPNVSTLGVLTKVAKSIDV